MLRAKCPDPALLQAYVDKTLFSRDVTVVEQHVTSCERCAAILVAMQQEREAPSSRWSPSRVAGVALAVIAVAGIATWALRSGSNDAPPPLAAPAPPAETPAAPAPVSAPAPTPKPVAPPPKPAPAVAERRQPVVKEQPPPADVTPSSEVTDADSGVTIRGTRRSNRDVVWRARDLVIEHSTDGGKTWTTEYKADRPVRAGAFVSSDVAWLVGDDGLVLRRTKNGWFGTTQPADGNIQSIRASSTGRATVTFEDGRLFTTENGGVTWSLVLGP